MNALNPPVSVLIKLAQMVFTSSVNWSAWPDSKEVLEWYDRMAQLEYVPARLSSGLTIAVTKIPEGQTASLSLLDGPEDQIECGAVISIPGGKRVGYQISARHPTEGIIASYYEATTLSLAAEACLNEFPQAEGFKDHAVKNTETGVETKVPPIPDLIVGLETGTLSAGLSLDEED